jgi:hypothetical protein
MDNKELERGIIELIRQNNVVSVKYLLSQYTGNKYLEFLEKSVIYCNNNIIKLFIPYYDSKTFRQIIKLAIDRIYMPSTFRLIYDIYNNFYTAISCLEKHGLPLDIIKYIYGYIKINRKKIKIGAFHKSLLDIHYSTFIKILSITQLKPCINIQRFPAEKYKTNNCIMIKLVNKNKYNILKYIFENGINKNLYYGTNTKIYCVNGLNDLIFDAKTNNVSKEIIDLLEKYR